MSLYVTGKLLGHRHAGTTQRYAHLERTVARSALDRVTAVLTGTAAVNRVSVSDDYDSARSSR